MKRIIAIGLAVMFTLTGLVIMPDGITQDAGATLLNTYQADVGVSGYITSVGGVETVYTGWTGVSYLYLSNSVPLQSDWYLTYNTSAITNESVVLSATLFAYYVSRDISPVEPPIEYVEIYLSLIHI